MVETRLIELIPCEAGKKTTNYISYERIKDIDIRTLKEILKARLLNPKWNIEDTGDYLTYQYEDKPKLYISKKNGRISSEENNRFSQWQAYILLRMLVKFGYVQGYVRHQRRKFCSPY